jgi:hypothetical protein
VKRDGRRALVALLAAGILAARGAAWLRARFSLEQDPASRLASQGLLVGFRGDALGARIAELGRFPLYRFLMGNEPAARIRGALRWGASVPDPFKAVATTGTSALGFYGKGWALVRPAAGAPRAPGMRDDGAWRLLASDASLLPRPGDPREAPRPTLARGEVEIRADVPGLAGLATRSARAWSRLLPRRAVGRLRVESGRLKERWEIVCEDGCLLDLLDARGATGADARGWSAIPGSTRAVAWFLLDPRRLAELAVSRPGEEGFPPLARLVQIEQFVGLPVTRELGAALAGPAVVAVIEDGSSDETRPLLALDLVDPERARRTLDRVAALGMLSGAIRRTTYRDVPIASWAAAGRRLSIEPAAAVEAGVLLLALRRADIADAIDRLRAAGLRRTDGLPGEVASLPRGAWKAASRSAALVAAWERILVGEAALETAQDTGLTRAVLDKQGNRWILEGSGSAPAVALDPLLPSLRRISRAWPERARRQ